MSWSSTSCICFLTACSHRPAASRIRSALASSHMPRHRNVLRTSRRKSIFAFVATNSGDHPCLYAALLSSNRLRLRLARGSPISLIAFVTSVYLSQTASVLSREALLECHFSSFFWKRSTRSLCFITGAHALLSLSSFSPCIILGPAAITHSTGR